MGKDEHYKKEKIYICYQERFSKKKKKNYVSMCTFGELQNKKIKKISYKTYKILKLLQSKPKVNLCQNCFLQSLYQIDLTYARQSVKKEQKKKKKGERQRQRETLFWNK